MAYYCLHQFHWSPSKVADLTREELAFIGACIEIKAEADENEAKELEKSGKGKNPKKSSRRKR